MTWSKVEEFVCPEPKIWAKTRAALMREFERRNDIEQAPPKALVLGGWVHSDDFEKKEAWEATVQWADENNCSHLIPVLGESERHVCFNIVTHNELIEKTNTILDGVSRLKQEWDRSKETIESVNQMRIVADGYIQSLQEANQSLGQCVDGLIDEVDRIQAVNDEVLRTAEAMAKIGKGLG